MRFMLERMLVAIFACGMLAAAAHAQDNWTHPRMISVTGTAEIKVAPDEIQLTLGVDTRDKDLTAAKDQNDRRVRKALALARSAGVEAKDMQTSAVGMGADYSDEKVPRLLGYHVSQTITITLKNISKYEGLMAGFLRAGVNRVDEINFLVSNAKKLRADARLQAVRAAQEKAAAMAGELGEKIGKPWEITEQGGDEAELVAGLGEERVMPRFAAPEGPAIAGGEITIRATVQVSFQLD